MDCEHARIQITEHLAAAEDLPPELGAHVRRCAGCAELLRAERAVRSRVHGARWPEAPPALDVARVRRRAVELAADEASAARRASTLRRWRLGAASTGLLAIAVAWLGWRIVARFNAPGGPDPVGVAAFLFAGTALWAALGTYQRRLADDRLGLAFGLRLAQGGLVVILGFGVLNPEVQHGLQSAIGRLSLHSAQADVPRFDSALLCARARDGFLRLAESALGCGEGEVIVSGEALLGPGRHQGAIHYRAGTAVIRTDQQSVRVQFASPMPSADYRVVVSASQGYSPVADDDDCRHFNANGKNRDGFSVEFLKCAQRGPNPVPNDVQVDWIAIEAW